MGFLRRPQNLKKIFFVLLTRASCSVCAIAYLSKSQQRFFKTNVVNLYYTNFTYLCPCIFWVYYSSLSQCVLLTKSTRLTKPSLEFRSDPYINSLSNFDPYKVRLKIEPKFRHWNSAVCLSLIHNQSMFLLTCFVWHNLKKCK